MANKDDYLTEYRCFFENFAQTVNPNDQLPVKLGSYKLVNIEVVGGIIDWTTQYLTQKECPPPLIAPLIKIVIQETRKLCKKQPVLCGFNPLENAYEPLKLMQTVMAKTNEICMRYLDNSKLCTLPSPGPPFNEVTTCAIKNTRRRMEDRHVVIHDLNSLFFDQEEYPSSYYAIFDGHAGFDAAFYSSTHLHQFLAESDNFISNPEQALRDAFLKTDSLFIDKCKVENLSSGTTAVCALHRHKEKTIYIAWVGDSQAILVEQGKIQQCVQPHKPSREDEKQRIEKEGGCIMFWGTWRVNGQLAVSRAIGDHEYKPYVTAVPDIVEITLKGTEDFLILACDGLWDFLSETDAANCVYNQLSSNSDDIEAISSSLVQLAKKQGSCDNISVIVVFLRETSKIAAEAHWATRNNLIMDTLDNANTTNPFANSNNAADILAQKDNFVLNLGDNFKHNGTEKSSSNEFLCKPTNGKRPADEFDEDDDLGPETDVDAVDDVLLSPTTNNFNDGNINNNTNTLFDPFCNIKDEKATLEIASELQKQSSSEFDLTSSPREETPTPPVDTVHDASGLLENVADSGDDSDDEWNYFKGNTTNEKEKIASTEVDLEVCALTSSNLDGDTMSQLNPDAQEFVPVSPSRPAISPPFQTLIDDSIISQSPRRPIAEIDINLPNIGEFTSEIKNRASDLFPSNGSDKSESPQKLTSQEIMENFLNGKSIDEIEFQPNKTPVKVAKSDEFHFGPNATPFSTPAKSLDQSEAFSTKAVFGDESNASYLDGKALDVSVNSEISAVPSETDNPMSMSFYQSEENEETPFDLNRVQVLPENLEEFLNKSTENGSFNETISDLPEHQPLGNGISEHMDDLLEEGIQNGVMEIHENVKIQSPVPIAESPVPEAESPIPSHSPAFVRESPVPSPSPVPIADAPIHSPFIAESPIPPQSPVLTSTSPLPPQCSISKSPIPSQSPILIADSPIPPQSPILIDNSPIPPQSPVLIAESPIPPKSPALTSQSPIPPKSPTLTSQSPIPPSQSHINNFEFEQNLIITSQSPVDCVSPVDDLEVEAELVKISQSPLPGLEFEQSPAIELEQQSQSPLIPTESPVPQYQAQEHSTNPFLPSQSLKEELESPVDEATSSIKDSPVLEERIEDLIPSVNENQNDICVLNFAQEVSNAQVVTINPESFEIVAEKEEINDDKESFNTDPFSTKTVEVEIERKLEIVEHPTESIPAVTIPDNDKIDDVPQAITENLVQIAESADLIPIECVLEPPYNIEVKSELIEPEYPVESLAATPSEESKLEDTVRSLPEVEQNLSQIVEALVPSVVVPPVEEPEKKSVASKTKTTAIKKTTTKASPSAAKPSTVTKTTAATTKPAAATRVTAKTSTTTTTAATLNKSSTARAPLAKPKTAATTTAKKVEEVRAPIRKPASLSATSKPAPLLAATKPLTKNVPSKTSPTKTAGDIKTTVGSARPASSTTTKPSAARPASSTTSRPTTLTSRVSASKTTTSSTVTATKSTAKPSTTLTSPKVSSVGSLKPSLSAPTARPKPLASKTLVKTPEVTKQIKETTNKQITAASRAAANTSAKTTATSKLNVTSTTTRKVEAKVPASRTTTKTTTTTTKTASNAKKPVELVRSVNKSKAEVIKKAPLSTESKIIKEITNTEQLKEVLPVIENNVCDNSQLENSNAIPTTD